MTLDELREAVRTMKADADDRARTYGRLLGVDAAVVESLLPALGAISIDELFTVLEREAVAGRNRLQRALREADR